MGRLGVAEERLTGGPVFHEDEFARVEAGDVEVVLDAAFLPAGLNFGDCFSYAPAKFTDEPLLFNGTGFSRTDVKTERL